MFAAEIWRHFGAKLWNILMKEYENSSCAKRKNIKLCQEKYFNTAFPVYCTLGDFFLSFCHFLDFLSAWTFLLPTAKASGHFQCLPSVNWPKVVSDFLAVLTVKKSHSSHFCCLLQKQSGVAGSWILHCNQIFKSEKRVKNIILVESLVKTVKWIGEKALDIRVGDCQVGERPESHWYQYSQPMVEIAWWWYVYYGKVFVTFYPHFFFFTLGVSQYAFLPRKQN